jgi:hypothetical protein
LTFLTILPFWAFIKIKMEVSLGFESLLIVVLLDGFAVQIYLFNLAIVLPNFYLYLSNIFDFIISFVEFLCKSLIFGEIWVKGFNRGFMLLRN